MSVTTIDCGYLGRDGFAAAYLVVEGQRAAFVETCTARSVPRMLEVLAAAGRSTDDVEWVIVTHAHLDHAGGASALMEACPNAVLLAHPRAAPHLIDPTKLVASARAVYGDEAFDRLYGAIQPIPGDRVRTMGDGEELAFGSRTLRFLHTRGHANHHFCIHDSGTGGIFTGDSFGLVYPALQSQGLLAVPSTSPTDFDPEAAKASVDRILATGAEVAYLTHFGPQRDLGGIAEQLHRQLDAYGALLERADASGETGPALEAQCAEGVAAIFDQVLASRTTGDPREWLQMDIDLNGQGIAFAVNKRRFKRR